MHFCTETRAEVSGKRSIFSVTH